jgi:hypothetical protein
MKKIFKIIALIFIIAAVIFKVGCTQKKASPVNENVTQVREFYLYTQRSRI